MTINRRYGAGRRSRPVGEAGLSAALHGGQAGEIPPHYFQCGGELSNFFLNFILLSPPMFKQQA